MALKNLFDNYKEFGEIINNVKNGTIDLENFDFNPTTTLPLLCVGKSQNLKLRNGEEVCDFLENKLINNKLFYNLPKSRVESDESGFLTDYISNLESEYGSYFALRIIISEIANNIYDHSRDGNAEIQSYILSELYEKYTKLDICLVDDGLSIPGLFEKSNVDFDNDAHAIEKAIGVFSTVSESQFERGNGFWTVIRLIVEGNGGEILIVSRLGCLHICGGDYKYYLLHNEHKFNGTLVSVRLNKYEIQNIYDLIDFHKPNSYKLEVIYDY